MRIIQALFLNTLLNQKKYNILYQLKKEIYICLIMQKIVNFTASFRCLTTTATFTINTL